MGWNIRLRTTLKEHHKAESLLQKRHRLVLELLKAIPSQTRDRIAVFLDVSVATTRQLLRLMEDLSDIHSRPHPMQKKTKLYYTGTSPTKLTRHLVSNNTVSLIAKASIPIN